MTLSCFHLHHVRNLFSTRLSFHPLFNLFIGKNAQGKTSLLEAIYLLALGRSFRATKSDMVIAYPHASLACYGEVQGQNRLSLGIEKHRQGETLYKINGERCERLSDYAYVLPVQVITPDTFKLLLEGPEGRRRFLDWGVFHVEHSFGADCQRYLRLLKQRNALLKQSANRQLLSSWEKTFVEVGERISQSREHYLRETLTFINEDCQALLPGLTLCVEYERGWEQNQPFIDALSASYAQDRRLGYTCRGPHRAEIAIKLGGEPVSQSLSRGQQKLLICALHLAQGRHLAARMGKRCLYLLDDIGSELDKENRQRLLALLAARGHQVFLTGVDEAPWQEVCETFGGRMFHVEHGKITLKDFVTP